MDCSRTSSTATITTWDWTHVRQTALRESRALLGAGADAEDAAQEAALRAWRRRATCRSTASADAWLREIARNEALRLLGRRREEAPLEVAGERPSGSGDPQSRVDQRDVRKAIRGLAPEDRKLLLLRYWADLTQHEVARATAMPEGTVKIRLHRARKRLRSVLATG